MLQPKVKNRVRTSALQFEDWQRAMRRSVVRLEPDVRSHLIEYVVRELDDATKTGRFLPHERVALELLIESEPEPLVVTKMLEAAWLQDVKEQHLDSFHGEDVRFFDRIEARSSMKLAGDFAVISDVGRRRYVRPAGSRFHFPSSTSEVLCLVFADLYRVQCFEVFDDGVSVVDFRSPLIKVFVDRRWIPGELSFKGDYRKIRKSMQEWFFSQLAHLEYRVSHMRHEVRYPVVDRPVIDVQLQVGENGRAVETFVESGRTEQLLRIDHLAVLPPYVNADLDGDLARRGEVLFAWVDAVDLAFVSMWREQRSALNERTPSFVRVFRYSSRFELLLRQTRDLAALFIGLLALSALCGRCGW